MTWQMTARYVAALFFCGTQRNSNTQLVYVLVEAANKQGASHSFNAASRHRHSSCRCSKQEQQLLVQSFTGSNHRQLQQLLVHLQPELQTWQSI